MPPGGRWRCANDNRNNNIGFHVAGAFCAGAIAITVRRDCLPERTRPDGRCKKSIARRYR
jgi:hypothetical protein